MANPNWTKGTSGNPNGRPKKDRALTAILEAAGSKAIDNGDGKSVARKRLMAEMLWKAVTEGAIELPNGKILDVAPADWFDTVQFLYKHIDGPPKTNVDVTSGGEKIQPVVFDYAKLVQNIASRPTEDNSAPGEE